MKSKLMLTLVMVVALSVGLLACAPTAEKVAVEVSIDDFTSQNHITRELTVNAGDSFTLTLGSNPTTGFTWPDEPQISDQTVVQQTDHKFVPPEETEPPIVGAGGEEGIYLNRYRKIKMGISDRRLKL